jgi:uncharacterized RDD family membrane protein YckC
LVPWIANVKLSAGNEENYFLFSLVGAARCFMPLVSKLQSVRIKEMIFMAIQGVPKEVRTFALNRVFAKAIDFAVVVLISLVLPFPWGAFLGFFYSIVADGMPIKGWTGQSLGKRLVKLKVMSQKRAGEPCTLQESMLRNSPVAVFTFFALIPFWGWLIVLLVGIPLLALEVYFMLTAEKGRRIGDLLGETEVTEV